MELFEDVSWLTLKLVKMITCCQPWKTARDYYEIYLSIFSHDFRQLKITTIPGKNAFTA